MSDGQRPGADPKGRFWLCEALWRLGCVQFGDFSMGRTVRHSPIYLNPKLLIARPDHLARAAAVIDDELQMAMTMRNQQVARFDLIAGVPMGGLHVATALSLRTGTPLLYARPDDGDEDEGRRPRIEGIYRPGQVALVVDDLAAGGGSLVETVDRLRRAGMVVRDAVVLVDREQGAAHRLEQTGVRLHPILTLEALLTHLNAASLIAQHDFERAITYLRTAGDARSEYD